MTSQEATKLSVVVSESDVEARELLDGAWDDLVRAQRRPNPTMLGGWPVSAASRNFSSSARSVMMRDASAITAARSAGDISATSS